MSENNGVNINKLLIRRLADLGVTTVDKCCTDGTETIDEKIAAINTKVGAYTEFKVLITQSGTALVNGDATVLIDTLGGAYSFAYTSAGLYTLTNTGKFTSGKTSVTISATAADSTVYAVRTSADVITFGSAVGHTGVATNALLTGATLTVRVYA